MSGHQPEGGELPPPPASKRLHKCEWPGCERVIARSMWGCRAHWYALPNNLRAWIGRAYRYGIDTGTHPTRSYVDAHRAALAWIAEHRRPEHENEV
jgi:hypothetical protein